MTDWNMVAKEIVDEWCTSIGLTPSTMLWGKLSIALSQAFDEGRRAALPVTGETSDGYHTFNELYDHRCLLFINLCLCQPTKAYWRPHYEEWPLIGLETTAGQVTYHVPEKYLPLFKDKINEGGPEWDGHTASQVVDRLRNTADNLKPAPCSITPLSEEDFAKAFNDWTIKKQKETTPLGKWQIFLDGMEAGFRAAERRLLR